MKIVIITTSVLVIFFFNLENLKAQDSSKINVTSSAGIILPFQDFANSFKPSFSVGTGLVLKLKKQFFLNGTFSVNMLKYDQKVLDKNSDYFFTKSGSPFIQVGISFGKNFGRKKWIYSPYIGGGAYMLNEPRLNINQNSKVATQSYLKHFGPHITLGQRLYFNTKTNLLKTIYIDTFFWKSSLKIQKAQAQSFSILLGIKIGK